MAQAELTTNQVFNVNFADGSYTNGRIVATNLGIYQGNWQQTSTTTNNGPFITNNNQAVLPSGATGQDIWKAFTSNTIVLPTNNFGGYLQTKINFSITSATTNGDFFSIFLPSPTLLQVFLSDFLPNLTARQISSLAFLRIVAPASSAQILSASIQRIMP